MMMSRMGIGLLKGIVGKMGKVKGVLEGKSAPKSETQAQFLSELLKPPKKFLQRRVQRNNVMAKSDHVGKFLPKCPLVLKNRNMT